MKKFLLTFLLLSLGAYAMAQEEPEVDPYSLSLEELMNIPVSVSKSDLSLRETPSVISVITREEIRNMGARDLMDVLNQVPGFSFGLDVQNVVGLGSRGNWGHEGKILLLMDGQEMNEILFSSTQFGQHYDINNIERIEIIRGPGSSIYGGYAELGVINIITRKGGQLNGLHADVLAGTTSNGFSRFNTTLSAGQKTDNVEYSVSAHIGEGIRSDQTYFDLFGNSADLTNKSTLRPLMVNAALQVKGFSARVIFDDYKLKTIDQFDEIPATGVPDEMSFRQLFGELKYTAKASEKLTITPRVNFKTGHPWKTSEDAYVPYLLDARRISPAINFDWNPSAKVSVVAGADSYFDHAEYTGSEPDYFGDLSTGNNISFYNIGLFAQSVFKTDVINITLGSRFDSHSQFGTAFSPRIGFTKAYNKLHFKVLYSRAFRSPALENMNYNPEVKPEKTGVAEIEVGYKLNDNMFLTGNVFHIRISDPIVYFVDANNPVGTYDNFNKAGSVGFELDYRMSYDWGSLSLNYAYYNASNANDVPYYTVPNDDSRVLALPGSRVNAFASFKLGKGFSI
ncbi:MAG: TonB-dependent receptor plug domain-containing protein, partial [Cyclobacteriaceae bacterium]|nr:TonB-dependent receptor plug domain-containing protein [Cyclobacteriaceae bacterium]